MTEAQLLQDAMAEIGLRKRDLVHLTGVDRRTVWRWFNGQSEVPVYARTIVDQQVRIRKLVDQITD